ncbi:GHKL domain-containing protein [Puniceicoccales bacterium CK1056]|uniref:histidine kinase n=1 Tax=Oceanipulchritudo coccoides TaxID=2706888 RepID=A0A6B2LZ41_9BACT|nr:ATP-binding protein [Oceanipulchritudo coccoides]NDV61981.1 GHKL domain-containing protein [Oceanipulchritudo coccoides]
MGSKGKRRLSHQHRIQLLAFLCGAPGLLAALILLIVGDYGLKVYLTVFILVGSAWFYFSIRIQSNIILPLQTASNMLSALREGDFSLKANYLNDEDALGQLMMEINMLTDVLSEHRMDAMEAHALMDKVIQEIDAAVITFDPECCVKLANEAARRLLGIGKEQITHRYAAELNLDKALESPPNAIIPHPNPDRSGRFTVRRGTYRVAGQPHELLILIDVSRNLREEELLAWKRLIRVLGHELNNSMAPIRSLSESLQRVAAIDDPEPEDREDLVEGLEIIRQRADGLSRFINEYARLAKLPHPKLKPVPLKPLVRRIASLYEDPEVKIDPANSPDVTLQADPDQLEQALLNLVKNGVEAATQTDGWVKICWREQGDALVLHVEDSGPGIANPDNLFIPFFSTKEGGSGIGLTLSRQIIEAHEGSLALANREDAIGCCAEIILPRR